MIVKINYWLQFQAICRAKLSYHTKFYFTTIKNTRVTASPIWEVLDAPYCTYTREHLLTITKHLQRFCSIKETYSVHFPVIFMVLGRFWQFFWGLFYFYSLGSVQTRALRYGHFGTDSGSIRDSYISTFSGSIRYDWLSIFRFEKYRVLLY